MKEKLKVVLKYAPYVILTLLLTVYFMFLTFPFTEVKNRLLPSLDKSLPCNVSVNQIHVTPLLWLSLSQVQISLKQGDGSTVAEIHEMKIKPSLLNMIIGKWTFRLKAKLMDGSIKGKFVQKKGNLDLDFAWKGIQPGKHPLLVKSQTMKMEAAVSGDLKLHMKGGNWMTSEGTVSLDLAKGSIQDLQVYGFTLPDVQGLKGTGIVKLKKGEANVETFSLTSDQLVVSMNGTINLARRRLDSSRLNLKGKLKLLGQLGTEYQPMLDSFLRNKDAEGAYLFSLKGTLGSPRFST